MEITKFAGQIARKELIKLAREALRRRDEDYGRCCVPKCQCLSARLMAALSALGESK